MDKKEKFIYTYLNSHFNVRFHPPNKHMEKYKVKCTKLIRRNKRNTKETYLPELVIKRNMCEVKMFNFVGTIVYIFGLT